MSEVLRGLSERLKIAKSKPGLNGYQPHPKQQEFHSSTAKGTLFLGGNRSGKTVGGAVETIYRLKGEHPYKEVTRAPTRCRSVSVDLLQGVYKIVIPEISKWIPPSLLKNGSWDDSYNKGTRTLHLTNGSFLEFLSYDQDTDKHAGTSRDWIWFDEEPPKDIFDENAARLIDTGGHWGMTMTPLLGLTWVYDDIYNAGPETAHLFKIVEVSMDENPHLDSIEVEAFLVSLTSEERKARQEGRFISKTGMVYQNHFREHHIIPPISASTLRQNGEMIFCAMDHGFTNPTCFLWMSVNKDGRIIIFDEYYESQRTVAENAAAVIAKFEENGGPPSYTVGDPSIRNTDPITGTSVLIEYTNFGIPIMLGNHDQKAGINLVIQRLKGPGEPYRHPQLFVTENCTNLIWEMKKLRWGAWHSKKMQADRNAKEEQHKKDDHGCDAMRYGVSSRPEVDQGQLPVGLDRILAAHAREAIDPEKDRFDKGVFSPRRQPVDAMLGSDW